MEFPKCPLFGVKIHCQNALGPRVVVAVWSLEVRGRRFLEFDDVLQVWDLQSVIRALFALESASASRTVRFGRFYCTAWF